ncbi:MAG: hypothetical protein ABR976_09110 [Terracidiphilus sp.]
MSTILTMTAEHGNGHSRSVRTALLALGAAGLLACTALSAQSPATPTAPTQNPAPKPAHPHKRSSATHPAAVPPPVTPAPVTPPAPEIPKWPANEKPEDATVTWDSQGLRINASNSSLEQILDQVSTATGAKVEGIDKDERIFGAYGPGQPRDVLSQLLEGSGYNVLMIGDQGQGAPRQIVLSPRHPVDALAAKNATPTPAVDEDNDVEEQPQPQDQRPANPPFRQAFPGGPARTPQNPGQPGQQPPQPAQPGTQPQQRQ